MLPTEAQERKEIPVASGFVDYFPDAMVEVARLSKIGNDQHNPGKPLFWDRSKSGDEADAMMRHFVERGTIDSDGVRHSAKVAWRAMALLQKELEDEAAKADAGEDGNLWIKWDGGTECPLEDDVTHEVMFRNGRTVTDDLPQTWDWECQIDPLSIIAYRRITS